MAVIISAQSVFYYEQKLLPESQLDFHSGLSFPQCSRDMYIKYTPLTKTLVLQSLKNAISMSVFDQSSNTLFITCLSVPSEGSEHHFKHKYTSGMHLHCQISSYFVFKSPVQSYGLLVCQFAQGCIWIKQSCYL